MRAVLATVIVGVWTANAGVASWYGWEHQGKLMANGQRFDCRRMTAASWHYPLGTWVAVSHRGRTVRVRITDRGPAHHLDREIDLSLAAFRLLRSPDVGLINVRVRR